MSDIQLERGRTYSIKLTTGKWVRAEYIYETQGGGFNTRSLVFGTTTKIRMKRRYHFRNLSSNREVILRSMQKVKADYCPCDGGCCLRCQAQNAKEGGAL